MHLKYLLATLPQMVHNLWQVMQRDSDMLIAVSHVHLYFVKGSMSESTAMQPQYEKSIISASVTNVAECQTTLMQASFHAV